MKYVIPLLLLIFTQKSYSQTTHSILVAVNQPDECVIAGIDDSHLNINVYPNPAGQSLNIFSENNIDEVSIIDTTGRIVYTRKQKGNQFNLDVSHFNRGIYQCIIKHTTGIKRTKIILQ